MTMVVVLIIAHAIGALALTVAAARSFRAAWRWISGPTLPIGALQEGDRGIRGTVRLCGESLLAPSGRECVAARVTVESRSANKKQLLSNRETTRCVAFEVVDETGCCVVRARDARVLAPGLKTEMTIGGLREAAPQWVLALAHDKASLVNVSEFVVRAGDTVLVHGRATMREERPGDGYREGKQAGWRMTSPAESETLIAMGTKGGLVLRAAAGPVLTLMAAAGMIASIWLGIVLIAS